MSGFELALSDETFKNVKSLQRKAQKKPVMLNADGLFVYLQLKHSIAEDDGDGRHLSEVQAQSVAVHRLPVHCFGL